MQTFLKIRKLEKRIQELEKNFISLYYNMIFNQLPQRSVNDTSIMTFNQFSNVPESLKTENKLYFIKSQNKYYRYNTDNELFEVVVKDIDLTSVNDAIATKQNTLTAGSNLTLSGDTIALNNSIDLSGYVVSNTMTTNSIQSNTALHEYILMKSITNPSIPNTITITRDKIEWNGGSHVIGRYNVFFASEISTQYETTPLSSSNTLTTKSYVDNQIASGSSNGHTLIDYTSTTLFINTVNKIIDLKKEDLFLERTIIGESLQMQTSSGLPSILINANSMLISGCTEPPTEDDHLTNKAYVDTSIASILPNNNKVELIIQVITHNRSIKIDSQTTTNITGFSSYYTKIGPGLYNINLNSSVTFSNSMNTSHYLGFQIVRKSDNKVLTIPNITHVYLKSTLFKNHETKNDSWVFNNNFLMIDGVISANGLSTGFSSATQQSSNVAVVGQFVIVGDFFYPQ